MGGGRLLGDTFFVKRVVVIINFQSHYCDIRLLHKIESFSPRSDLCAKKLHLLKKILCSNNLNLFNTDFMFTNIESLLVQRTEQNSIMSINTHVFSHVSFLCGTISNQRLLAPAQRSNIVSSKTLVRVGVFSCVESLRTW